MIYNYKIINLKSSNFKYIINIFIVTNINQGLELSYNLLSNIPFIIKGIEVFLRNTDQHSKILVSNIRFNLVDIIQNQ